ncbi:MAG: arginine deiminase-related protein, partial [Flavobacteriales bacterium]
YAERFNKTLVQLTTHQTKEFAGNILEVLDSRNSSCVVISSRAFNSLQPSQVKILESVGNVIPVDLSFIEKYGGGSARCMIAELF